MAGKEANGEESLKDKLDLAKEKIRFLTKLMNEFDALQAETKQLQEELEEIEVEEKSLSATRAKLGIFSGKEKKQIDMKLVELTTQKGNIVKQIRQKEQKRSGYDTTEDIHKDIEAERIVSENLEEQIAYERDNAIISYSFAEAVQVYRYDSDIALKVNEICPQAMFILAMQINAKSVKFGRYFQNSDRDFQPIKWKVLAVKDGRMLLISRQVLEGMKYSNEDSSDINWKHCSLCKWLNTDFVTTAFTVEESALIATLPKLGDKVFLLSEEEADTYFASNNERKCTLSNYARSQAASMCWFLRTPSKSRGNVICVNGNGEIKGSLTEASARHGVRPAIWIDLNP